MEQKPPSTEVLSAFGAEGQPMPVDGGQGSSWAAGDLVLKPLDLGKEELEWQAGVFASIRSDGFRVAQPRRAADGSLVVSGWCAWDRVEGRHEQRRWPEIIAAGERFHAALADVPCPSFIAQRTDCWAIGDRVAWGDLPLSEFDQVKHLDQLVAALRPVDQPSQLIHGDLTGNVLFADGLAPAIIDFSPYRRPTGFASAIVLGDALIWEGADASILDAVGHIEQFDQLLLRAVILSRRHRPTLPTERTTSLRRRRPVPSGRRTRLPPRNRGRSDGCLFNARPGKTRQNNGSRMVMNPAIAARSIRCRRRTSTSCSV